MQLIKKNQEKSSAILKQKQNPVRLEIYFLFSYNYSAYYRFKKCRNILNTMKTNHHIFISFYYNLSSKKVSSLSSWLGLELDYIQIFVKF